MVLPHVGIGKRASPLSSIYTAELNVILVATACFLRIDKSSFEVFSDSRSALQSICNPFFPHPVVTQLHVRLNMLRASQKTVRFCWVLSYVDVPGNEKTDWAALAMASSEGSVPSYKMSRPLLSHSGQASQTVAGVVGKYRAQ